MTAVLWMLVITRSIQRRVKDSITAVLVSAETRSKETGCHLVLSAGILNNNEVIQMTEHTESNEELAILEASLAGAKKEVDNHMFAYRRARSVMVKIETQLITAREEVARVEEVVRLYKQHKVLSSIEDDLRETEIKRFRAAMPAAMKKINEQDAVKAQVELDRFKKRMEEIVSKQNFSKQLVEEHIPETLQE
jgi:hypothetical protein